MKIKSLPKIDLPREKLEKYGVEKLADHELLALLLGSGVQGVNVLELSRNILKTIRKIGWKKIAREDLLGIKGLGKAKAGQVMGFLELGRRLNTDQVPEIISPADVWKLCADIRESKREHVVAFYLDIQNHLIERSIVSIGTLDASLIHPREVFEPAIRLHSAAVIIAHNHPSGDIRPSSEDKEVTRRLVSVGNILGIALADHVIISKSAFLSFQQEGLL